MLINSIDSIIPIFNLNAKGDLKFLDVKLSTLSAIQTIKDRLLEEVELRGNVQAELA